MPPSVAAFFKAARKNAGREAGDLPASVQSPVQSRERKRAVSRDDHNIMRSKT